jgi:hypothetical protein
MHHPRRVKNVAISWARNSCSNTPQFHFVKGWTFSTWQSLALLRLATVQIVECRPFAATDPNGTLAQISYEE